MITTAEILASYSSPQKFCLMGNEAVARGAIEAGVRGVFAYPGTPSTEISEALRQASEFQHNPQKRSDFPDLTADPIYFEFSVNEKIAVEKAIAFTLGNRSAMCCMKSAGLNVASDPLLTIPYQTIGQPLVVVVCDDPGCFSSTTEQDSRYWGRMASLPVFNPATPQDALDMTKEAFELSGKLKIPVIVRMTTRVSHSRGVVQIGEISPRTQTPAFTKSPQHINIPTRTAGAHRALLAKLSGTDIKESLRRYTVQSVSVTGETKPDLGVISCGVANSYAVEIIARNRLSGRVDVLKVGISHPFPEKEVIGFLRNGYRKVLVLEELDPIVENETRILSEKNKLNIEILGKEFAGLTTVGEYSLDIVSRALSAFAGIEFLATVPLFTPSPPPPASGGDQEGAFAFLKTIPPRPPAMCPGCSHRATFYALKLAIYPTSANVALCGDIGCFAMGAFAPFEMIDTIHHMGMSLSMAQGLAEAFRSGDRDDYKSIALVGDGTMFHSGIASLMNAVYTRANVMIVVFDNRIIGMTGHQPHPGSDSPLNHHQIDLKTLALAIGADYAEVIDPHDIARAYDVMKEAWACRGVSAVISRSPCVFLPEFKSRMDLAERIEVDPSRCNTCDNQEDGALVCSRCSTPESNILKARAKLTSEIKIPALEQRCPANICNHGFFTALLNGSYGEAIQIVRDKTLFARVCGDICPRPCEYLYREEGAPVVPIRKLKHFVTGTESFFQDMPLTSPRALNGKKVAVVGAGPAGLSAAYDLARAGYSVTVFEREHLSGGLLKSVIPDFRIDKAGYDREINILQEWGVNFEYGKTLGRDFSLNSLSEDSDAVVLAIGMGDSIPLQIVEEQVPVKQRNDAITFLRDCNLGTPPIQPGAKVLVVGGGNSAIDSARAALRTGAAEVVISYRRSRADMPAFDEEIETALSEGVRIVFDSVIARCISQSDGSLKIELNAFSDGQPRGFHNCDYVIAAVGQRGREDVLAPYHLHLNGDKRVVSDPRTGRTSLRNVFVAGDICAGNHVSLIGAIAGGKKAANGIRALLEGYPFAYEGNKALDALNDHPRTGYHGDDGPPITDFDDFQREISKYYLAQSCRKCNHCIENFGCPALIMVNGKVVIDDIQCTRCGLCIDVCINDAIHWVNPQASLGKNQIILSADA